jgi:putative transposase
MVTARVRRQQVLFVPARGISQRRACEVLTIARSTFGYQSRLIERDTRVGTQMRELSADARVMGIDASTCFSTAEAS